MEELPLNRTYCWPMISKLASSHEAMIIAVLLVFYACLASYSVLHQSATFDETAHLAAGFTYLDRGDFRLNPEHPPLAKAWCALPVWLMGRIKADYRSPAWESGDQWEFGFKFLQGNSQSQIPEHTSLALIPARLAAVLSSMILGLVLYLFSREIWGKTGALTTLFLFTFSPTLLAHGALVTTDVSGAMGIVSTLWAFWRVQIRRTPMRILGLGICLGVALLTKYSNILLLPCLLLLQLFWITHPTNDQMLSRDKWWSWISIPGAFLVAWIAIWAFYAFRHQAIPNGVPPLHWDNSLENSPCLYFLSQHKLLPESFAYGIAYCAQHMNRQCFLNGDLYNGSRWGYFPEAFLLKSTPATLLLTGALLLGATVGRRWRSLNAGFITLPLACYSIASMFLGPNIGHRHLMPVYPLLFVLAGSLTRLHGHWPWAPRLTGLLLACQAVSALGSCPHYLSYFNFLAGGSSGGNRFLSDSNVDWGQDLPALKSWMTEHRVDVIDLAYFGTADPKAYRIAYKKVYLFPELGPVETTQMPKPGDFVAVSATLMAGLYVPNPNMRDQLLALRDRSSIVGKAGYSMVIFRIPNPRVYRP